MNQPVAGGSADAKPKWLNPLIVSAIVIGSLFGCCGVTTVGGVAVSRSMPQVALQAQLKDAKDPAAADAFRQVADRQLAFQKRTFPLTLTAGLLGLLQSIALLVAGILAHQRQTFGRKLLAAVCVVGIGVELIGAGIGLYLSRETSAYTEDMMKATFAAQQAQQPQLNEQVRETVEDFSAGAARVGSVLGVVMMLGFLVIKAGYYLASTLYLRRPEVIEYFEAPRAASS